MSPSLADFGLRKGINEVIGITKGEWINTAPLGIIVEDDGGRKAKVRLYSNHTRKNIRNGSPLWINVIDDAVIFALASFKDLESTFFESLDPPVIKGALSWCRMETELKGSYAELELVEGKLLRKELRAVNRGFNAIIEALVHATRMISLRKYEKDKVEYYLKLAEKCGGDREKRAAKIIREILSELP
jgi:hypothetical protein